MTTAHFKNILSTARHVVIIAGAGLSAASGIPTFQGAGGLWRRYDAMSLATPEAFSEDPSLVWQFYHYRRHVASRAQPNAAHRAIALLSSSREKLHHVAPNAQTLTLITQNVDNLSRRALPSDTPSVAQPIEMHGNIFRVKCTTCDYVGYNYDDPICPALGGTELIFENNMEPEPLVEVSQLPKCPQCDELVRPGVVWFGEAVEHLDEINEILEKQCDLVLVVGTSSTVFPANAFASIAKRRGAKVALFNIEKTEGIDEADFIFIGPCEVELPKALGVEDLVQS